MSTAQPHTHRDDTPTECSGVTALSSYVRLNSHHSTRQEIPNPANTRVTYLYPFPYALDLPCKPDKPPEDQYLRIRAYSTHQLSLEPLELGVSTIIYLSALYYQLSTSGVLIWWEIVVHCAPDGMATV